MELLRGSLRWISFASILLLGVELVVAPLYIANLAVGGGAALARVQLMIGDMGLVLALRLILVFIGAGVFGIFLYQSSLSADKMNLIAAFALGAFTLVLVSEVMGRFLFYATHVAVGI
jgi:anaerobic dimethyl sulfoxide reductase subunit C